MVFIIIPSIICVFLWAIFILRFLSKRRENEDQTIDLHPTYFSVADYYERIEEASLEIQKKKEQQKAYTMTLWAGLDGLQMNEDGSTHWVRRGEPERATPIYQSAMNYAYHSDTMPTQNMFNVQNQMLDLQSQNQALLMSQYQCMQAQNMISAIQSSYIQTIPSYYPFYPTQCCYNYRG